MARLLITDDDPAILGLIRAILEPEGFEIAEAHNGIEAVEAVERSNFDLLILDIMMPEMDGLEACRRIRQFSDVPIIFLSAKDEEADTVIGFALGADDYITKPFKPRELTARVRARLRRSTASPTNETMLEAADIVIDLRAHSATLHALDLNLTPKEFDILTLLVRNASCPVSPQDIFEQVWQEQYRLSDANTIMVHIRRLRKKLSEIDSSQAFIETVFGVGYRIDDGSGADRTEQ